MSPDEARSQIVEGIEVSQATVAQAKAYVVRYCQQVADVEARDMISELLRRMGFASDPFVDFVSSSDIDSDLRRVSQYVTWYYSIREAVCALIHCNVLVLWGDTLDVERPAFRYRLASVNASWEFPEFSMAIPRRIRLAPSIRHTGRMLFPGFLSDADLFLSELSVPGLPEPIVQSLRDAVTCFRYDLYTPCLAMLGQVIEGSLGQLALALVDLARQRWAAKLKGGAKDTVEAIERRVPRSEMSLDQLIDTVDRLYSNQDLFEELWEGVNSDIPGARNIVREIASWAHEVRDSRNVIHYGRAPSTRNTYEKVAVLLMATIPRLRQVYIIRATAGEMARRFHEPANDRS